MQISQFTADVQTVYMQNINDYAGIVASAKACAYGTGKPAVLCLSDAFTGAGHALLAYRWQRLSDTVERVYVYDSNLPTKTMYVTFYKNGSTYTGFKYDDGLGDLFDSTYLDEISYVDFSVLWKAWKNRGTASTVSTSTSMMTVSSQNAVIYNEAGIACAKISDGELVSSADSVYEANLFDVSTDDLLLYLPDGEYTVVDTDCAALEVSYCGDDGTAEVKCDSSTVKISSDSASISAESGDSFEITLGGQTESGTATEKCVVALN
jgi:hypothetical protein